MDFVSRGSISFRGVHGSAHTHRLLSSSFLGLPYRILNMNPKKELLRSLWVEVSFFFFLLSTSPKGQGNKRLNFQITIQV